MKESLLTAVLLQSAVLQLLLNGRVCSAYSPLDQLEIATTLSTQSRASQARETFLGSCTQGDFIDWYTNEIWEECRDLLSNTTLVEKFTVYCEEECGWMYFDFLRSCGELGELLVNFYEELCWSNNKGVPCYYFLMSDKYTNFENEVQQLCFPRNTTCPMACSNALESFSHKLGCCVNNIFNTTIPADTTQHALWSSCGVRTPLFCEDVEYEDEEDDIEDEDDHEDYEATEDEYEDSEDTYEEYEDTEDREGYENINEDEDEEDESEEGADVEEESADIKYEEYGDGKNSGSRVVVNTYKSFFAILLMAIIMAF